MEDNIYLKTLGKIHTSLETESSVVLSPKEINAILTRSAAFEDWMLDHLSLSDTTVSYLTSKFGYSVHEAENIVYDLRGEN